MPLVDRLCQTCFHEHKASATSTKATVTTSSGTHSRECDACECVAFTPKLPTSPNEVAIVLKSMSKLVGSAIADFGMINEGDKVLVGVSGGKDSLTLVHMLLHMQRRAPINFTVAAVTVDPQAPEYDPRVLQGYFAALGVPYYYESQAVLETAKRVLGNNPKASICAFCSRMRRGILYSACRREGYNVLALGQHMDDLAESFVMSAFHNGALRTMKVNYFNKQRDVRVIRPLCYVRESKTREFAKASE